MNKYLYIATNVVYCNSNLVFSLIQGCPIYLEHRKDIQKDRHFSII